MTATEYIRQTKQWKSGSFLQRQLSIEEIAEWMEAYHKHASKEEVIIGDTPKDYTLSIGKPYNEVVSDKEIRKMAKEMSDTPSFSLLEQTHVKNSLIYGAKWMRDRLNTKT